MPPASRDPPTRLGSDLADDGLTSRPMPRRIPALDRDPRSRADPAPVPRSRSARKQLTGRGWPGGDRPGQRPRAAGTAT